VRVGLRISRVMANPVSPEMATPFHGNWPPSRRARQQLRREVRRTPHARLECVHVRGEMPVPRPHSAMRKIREVLRLSLAEGRTPTSWIRPALTRIMNLSVEPSIRPWTPRLTRR
jgi:hypothetical protein